MSESKLYKISARYKKSVYQEEQYINKLSNGKKVIFEKTTFFRWGNFEIELTEKEKEEILEKTDIILNDYNSSCQELWDGCYYYEEIKNKDSYDKNEIKEINKLLYNIESEDTDDEEMNGVIDEDQLDENGWYLDETIYGITCFCELEEIS